MSGITKVFNFCFVFVLILFTVVHGNSLRKEKVAFSKFANLFKQGMLKGAQSEESNQFSNLAKLFKQGGLMKGAQNAEGVSKRSSSDDAN